VGAREVVRTDVRMEVEPGELEVDWPGIPQHSDPWEEKKGVSVVRLPVQRLGN
jgi:hypothetical protein